ncbi:MAG: DUF1489 domain-containing protein [Pseudomonadota bacterium]
MTPERAKIVHLLKLCVGADSVEDLSAWQQTRAARRGPGAAPVHVTRMWPRRSAEILAGGSIYWVIRGNLMVRQRITDLQPIAGTDGITRCTIVLDPTLVRTEIRPRKPFQGWRYLDAADAPADLGATDPDTALPQELQAALAEFGLLEKR